LDAVELAALKDLGTLVLAGPRDIELVTGNAASRVYARRLEGVWFVRISFGSWSDAEALRQRDTSIDNQPVPVSECAIAYPADGGDQPISWGDVQFADGLYPVPLPTQRGAWFSLRLQMFPDGRCGAAINGRLVAISEATLPLDRPYNVVVEGNSLGTRMLVGPLEVWEGVKGGVDWLGERSRSGPGRP
jgi:hypothetical protein